MLPVTLLSLRARHQGLPLERLLKYTECLGKRFNLKYASMNIAFMLVTLSVNTSFWFSIEN